MCHGDIKIENVMVSSWNWVFLTDFASFKPTFLPEDNPAEFSYFFDTSRKRTCYVAPERFRSSVRSAVSSSSNLIQTLTSSSDLLQQSASDSQQQQHFLPDDAARLVDARELQPSMDIFSVGKCL